MRMNTINWYSSMRYKLVMVGLAAYMHTNNLVSNQMWYLLQKVWPEGYPWVQGLIGQKTFVAEQPAPSADGQGGVKALSAGVDAVIAAILDWTATLPLDGTQASTAPPAPQRR